MARELGGISILNTSTARILFRILWSKAGGGQSLQFTIGSDEMEDKQWQCENKRVRIT